MVFDKSRANRISAQLEKDFGNMSNPKRPELDATPMIVERLYDALKAAREEINQNRSALRQTVAWGKEEGLDAGEIGQRELARRDALMDRIDKALKYARADYHAA